MTGARIEPRVHQHGLVADLHEKTCDDDFEEEALGAVARARAPPEPGRHRAVAQCVVDHRLHRPWQQHAKRHFGAGEKSEQRELWTIFPSVSKRPGKLFHWLVVPHPRNDVLQVYGVRTFEWLRVFVYSRADETQPYRHPRLAPLPRLR